MASRRRYVFPFTCCLGLWRRVSLQGSANKAEHTPPTRDQIATFCYTSGTTGDPKVCRVGVVAWRGERARRRFASAAGKRRCGVWCLVVEWFVSAVLKCWGPWLRLRTANRLRGCVTLCLAFR